MNYTKKNINDYELKYLIVQSIHSRKKVNLWSILIYFSFLIAASFIGVKSISLFESQQTGTIVLLLILFLSTILLAFIASYVSKKFNERVKLGYIQFFPTYFIIHENHVEKECFYEDLFRVQYAPNMLKDYFSKHPSPLTFDLLFTFKDGTKVLYQLEHFIRSEISDGMRSKLPDIFDVFIRARLIGGIHKNRKIINEFKKSKKGVNN